MLVISILVLTYFGSPRFENRIKINFITFLSDWLSISMLNLGFLQRSLELASSLFCVRFFKKKYSSYYILWKLSVALLLSRFSK